MYNNIKINNKTGGLVRAELGEGTREYRKISVRRDNIGYAKNNVGYEIVQGQRDTREQGDTSMYLSGSATRLNYKHQSSFYSYYFRRKKASH